MKRFFLLILLLAAIPAISAATAATGGIHSPADYGDVLDGRTLDRAQPGAVVTAPLAGFRLRHARGVALDHLTVRWASAPPAGATALDVADAELVRNDAFREERAALNLTR